MEDNILIMQVFWATVREPTLDLSYSFNRYVETSISH